MKKIRRFLQILLFINFMIGVEQNMKPANLALIIANGALVIGLSIEEMRREVDGREK